MSDERGKPVFQHPTQAPRPDMRLSQVFGDVRKPKPAKRRVHHLVDVIEDELSFDPNLQFSPSLGGDEQV